MTHLYLYLLIVVNDVMGIEDKQLCYNKWPMKVKYEFLMASDHMMIYTWLRGEINNFFPKDISEVNTWKRSVN